MTRLIDPFRLHFKQSICLQRDHTFVPSMQHCAFEALSRCFYVPLLRLQTTEPETWKNRHVALINSIMQ